MPSKPLGFCPSKGCPNRSSGPCPQCRSGRSRRKDSFRGSRHERGYTNKWGDYSKRRLEEHPLCVGYPVGVHAAKPARATCTDHIVSAKARPDLFWDVTNHASLCQACNKRKAIAEEGGFGRDGTRRGGVSDLGPA